MSHRITIGKVRFSYLNVFEAKETPNGEKKYSVSLIIPKKDTKTIEAINKAISDVIAESQAKLGTSNKAKLRIPLRDGDVDKEEDEAYQNSYFINASNKRQPVVVDNHNNKILDPDEVYSGCYGFACISFFAYNSNGNKGVGCCIEAIQKTNDGESLGGGAVNPDAVFKPVDDDDDDFLD